MLSGSQCFESTVNGRGGFSSKLLVDDISCQGVEVRIGRIARAQVGKWTEAFQKVMQNGVYIPNSLDLGSSQALFHFT